MILKFPKLPFPVDKDIDTIKRLYHILHEKRITAKQLAHMLDIPVICVDKWILGYPCTYEYLTKIAILLNVEPLWLITGELRNVK